MKPSTPDFDQLRQKLHQTQRLAASDVQGLARYYNRPLFHDFEIQSLQVKDYRLALYKRGPVKAKRVIMMHGLFDHSYYLGALLPLLIELDYEVWMIDLPGHGLSEGERTSVRSFLDYGEILQAVAQPEDLFVGFSTGCVAWIENPVCHRAVLLAPLLRPKAFQLSRIFTPLVSLWRKSVKRRSRPSSHDDSFLKWRNEDPQAPQELELSWIREMILWNMLIAKRPVERKMHRALVVYGTLDGTLDAKFGMKFLSERFDIQTAWIEGAEHQLLNENAQHTNQLIELIRTYLNK